jgi:hypothetical protein
LWFHSRAAIFYELSALLIKSLRDVLFLVVVAVLSVYSRDAAFSWRTHLCLPEAQYVLYSSSKSRKWQRQHGG